MRRREWRRSLCSPTVRLRGRLHQWLGPHDYACARGLIEECFSELFAPSPEGFRLLWRQEAREVLITWETDQRRG